MNLVTSSNSSISSAGDLIRVDSVRGLNPLVGDVGKKSISAFDIETTGVNNDFLMGSVVYEDKGFNRFVDAEVKHKFFYDKESFIKFFVDNDMFYRNHFVFATNLEFDLLGLFEDTEYFPNLELLFRGSRMLQGKYINSSRRDDLNNHKYSIAFLDTLNHLRASVKSLGELVGLPKFEHPSFLGEVPRDREEWQILRDYNLRDSMITFKFACFLQEQYNNIGCNLKCTLPSTSMDLFRRKYMSYPIKQPETYVLNESYKAYYGGRTEVIKRGRIKDLNLYDINSLYPTAMMLFDYPNPNKCYHLKNPNGYQIHKYEGISKVVMRTTKHLNIPYLGVRMGGKLKFPLGIIKGWYTHYEIREALKLGYEILKVEDTIYYTGVHAPFKEFVRDMYRNRLLHKNTKYELVYKILMNSLYGKFAQKIEPEPEIKHIDSFKNGELMQLWGNPNVELQIIGNYIRLNYKKPKRIPRYINPIYSIYTTAYARDILYKNLPKDVYYMDTDSCITGEKLDTGMGLGEWKLVDEIKDGIIVKPKFYNVNNDVKVKGCGGMSKDEFMSLVFNISEDKTPLYKYSKMSKYKESIRRDLAFNKNMEVGKEMSVEDDKRVWENKFNPDVLQLSKPIVLTHENYIT